MKKRKLGRLVRRGDRLLVLLGPIVIAEEWCAGKKGSSSKKKRGGVRKQRLKEKVTELGCRLVP